MQFGINMEMSDPAPFSCVREAIDLCVLRCILSVVLAGDMYLDNVRRSVLTAGSVCLAPTQDPDVQTGHGYPSTSSFFLQLYVWREVFSCSAKSSSCVLQHWQLVVTIMNNCLVVPSDDLPTTALHQQAGSWMLKKKMLGAGWPQVFKLMNPFICWLLKFYHSFQKSCELCFFPTLLPIVPFWCVPELATVLFVASIFLLRWWGDSAHFPHWVWLNLDYFELPQVLAYFCIFFILPVCTTCTRIKKTGQLKCE